MGKVATRLQAALTYSSHCRDDFIIRYRDHSRQVSLQDRPSKTLDTNSTISNQINWVLLCKDMILLSYFRLSQMVSGHVSFGMILPAANDLAQSSAFLGSAANIFMPGRKACQEMQRSSHIYLCWSHADKNNLIVNLCPCKRTKARARARPRLEINIFRLVAACKYTHACAHAHTCTHIKQLKTASYCALAWDSCHFIC